MAKLSIRLGPYWSKFSVQEGAAIGALARASDGTYWQINGDHRRKLNASKVAAALRLAEQWVSANTAGLPPAASPAKKPPAPTVIVKRRRVLAMQASLER
jgi:hypothetical protein